MARPKLGESETQRLQLKITEEEVAAIDDWRFSNRVNSRSEAVRRLCQLGVAYDQDVKQIAESSRESAKVADKAIDLLREKYGKGAKSKEGQYALLTVLAFLENQMELQKDIEKLVASRELLTDRSAEIERAVANVRSLRELIEDAQQGKV